MLVGTALRWIRGISHARPLGIVVVCQKLVRACQGARLAAGGLAHRHRPLVEVVGALDELTERLAKMESTAETHAVARGGLY